MSWNCENLKNNIHMLNQVLCSEKLLLVSLSETQLFQCDAYQVMHLVESEYNYFLNLIKDSESQTDITCPGKILHYSYILFYFLIQNVIKRMES